MTYTIRPLQWVYNTSMQQWEAPCLFGRISIYCTYATNEWRLYLPGQAETLLDLEQCKARAWAWYVEQLELLALSRSEMAP